MLTNWRARGLWPAWRQGPATTPVRSWTLAKRRALKWVLNLCYHRYVKFHFTRALRPHLACPLS